MEDLMIIELKDRKEKNVMSLMIEINREIYMNEITGTKLQIFQKIQNDIKNIILTKSQNVRPTTNCCSASNRVLLPGDR